MVHPISGTLQWPRFSGVRSADLNVPVFVEQVHDLLAAGLSVIEALETLHRGAHGRSRVPLADLIGRLRNGDRFSDALEAAPAFSPLLVALVRASELTSDLPKALDRYRDHQRQADELRHRLTTSVAIYPALVTLVGGLVLMFLTLYVMPRFARIFDGMNGELPWLARMMVAWAHWVGSYGGWFIAVLGAIVVSAIGIASVSAARHRALQFLLETAPLRSVMRTYFLARWYSCHGMLVEGGIPLATSSVTLANGFFHYALACWWDAVEQRRARRFESPAQAHARAGMATPVAEQLLLAGERIGDLGAVLSAHCPVP